MGDYLLPGQDSIRMAKSGNPMPPARQISLAVSHDIENPHPLLSQAVMAYGQFLDHDFNFTPMKTTEVDGKSLLTTHKSGRGRSDMTMHSL